MNHSSLGLDKLTVYQRSKLLVSKIYTCTDTWPHAHLFTLTDQLRRASLSIPLNIAEGYGRTRKDFQRFLMIARGSCYECFAIIDIAYQLKLLKPNEKDEFYDEIRQLSLMISSLRTSLSKKGQ